MCTGETGDAGALAQAACDFLEAHGAAQELHDIRSNAEPADILLEHIQSLKPRMLVMGAHSPHLLRDLFATSVTRAILRACPVPVFIGG